MSDLHDAKFGENHEDVVNKVKEIAPDAIFITGDFIDRNRYDLEQSLVLVEELKDVAPIYYVRGIMKSQRMILIELKEALRELECSCIYQMKLMLLVHSSGRHDCDRWN